jgi:hypothetical protein
LVRALRMDQERRPIDREPLGPFERLEVFPLLGPHGIRASMRVAIPTNQTKFSVRRSRRLRRSDCMSRCRRTFRRGKLQRGLDSIQSNTPTPRSSRCHVVRTGCSALFLFPGLYALIKDRLQPGALRDHGIGRLGGEQRSPPRATRTIDSVRFGSNRSVVRMAAVLVGPRSDGGLGNKWRGHILDEDSKRCVRGTAKIRRLRLLLLARAVSGFLVIHVGRNEANRFS